MNKRLQDRILCEDLIGLLTVVCIVHLFTVIGHH